MEPDGLVYLAMEFLHGRDLLAVLRDEWPLPDTRIVDLLVQTLAAVSVAHDLGIVHRDLKPENIMVSIGHEEDGVKPYHVKVCDFGIAKLNDPRGFQSESGKALTSSGTLIGTPEYMSPEQARGDPLDARSDLYSIGIVLYQLLVGRVPFSAENALGVVLKQVTDEPVPPSQVRPGVNPRLEAICLRALKKSRDDRYQSAKEMRRDLRGVFGYRPASQTDESGAHLPAAPPATPTRRAWHASATPSSRWPTHAASDPGRARRRPTPEARRCRRRLLVEGDLRRHRGDAADPRRAALSRRDRRDRGGGPAARRGGRRAREPERRCARHGEGCIERIGHERRAERSRRGRATERRRRRDRTGGAGCAAALGCVGSTDDQRLRGGGRGCRNGCRETSGAGRERRVEASRRGCGELAAGSGVDFGRGHAAAAATASASTLAAAPAVATPAVDPSYNPAGAYVVLGAMQRERVSESVMQGKMTAILPKLSGCYQSALMMAGAPVPGSAEIHMSIDDKGNVTAIVSAPKHPQFARCAQELLANQKVPVSALEGGNTTGATVTQWLTLHP